MSQSSEKFYSSTTWSINSGRPWVGRLPKSALVKHELANKVCRHIADDPELLFDFRRMYTGIGNQHHLVCDECEGTTLVALAPELVVQVEENGCEVGLLGRPELKKRDTNYFFKSEELPYRHLLAASHAEDDWLGLEPDGSLVSLTTDKIFSRISPRIFSLDSTLSLDIHNGLVFLSPRFGQHAEIFELRSDDSLMVVDRGTYHIEHCPFPHAFLEHEGETVLIHASDWNKLDITNPRSGASLVKRDAADRLDYFHCGLTLSPDRKRVANDGWVWHPVGIIQTWSAEEWLASNPFESEDGATKKALCYRNYLWDTAICWLNNTELAVWGVGVDEEEMLPAAQVFDTQTGQQKRWFYGPEIGDGGWFGFHQYLFSVSPQSGTTAWDIESGERVLLDEEFKPDLLHRGEFLTWRHKITRSRLAQRR